jgi:hypothetical protein
MIDKLNHPKHSLQKGLQANIYIFIMKIKTYSLILFKGVTFFNLLIKLMQFWQGVAKKGVVGIFTLLA